MKNMKKALALVLVVVMAIGTMAISASAASPVKYPIVSGEESVTKDQVTNTVNALDGMLLGLVGEEGLKGIKDAILPILSTFGVSADTALGSVDLSKALFSDATINMLADLIYPLDLDLSGIKINIPEKNLVDDVKDDYPKASEAISKGDFKGAQWGVKDVDTFIDALAAILRPLMKNTAVGSVVRSLYPDLVAVLKQFGISDHPDLTPDELKAANIADPDSFIKTVLTKETVKFVTDTVQTLGKLVKSLGNQSLNSIFAAPVSGILTALPGVASFLNDEANMNAIYDVVADANNLLKNLDNILSDTALTLLNGIVDGGLVKAINDSGITNYLDYVALAQEKGLEAAINKALADNKLALTLPKLPLADLAAAEDKTDAFVIVATYLFDVLADKDNLNTVKNLLKGMLDEEMYGTVEQLLDQIFLAENASAESLIVMLVGLLGGEDAEDNSGQPNVGQTGDAGIALFSALSLAAAAGFVFTKKRK